MSDDKIAEIRARHERDDCLRDGLCPGAHADRATLLAEVARLREDLALEKSRIVLQRGEIEKLRAENERLREALTDMLNGWRYIREILGDLAGVGWDRTEQKARNALEAKP